MAVFDNLGGGGSCNMKYEPETDMKYLKNADGEWIEECAGGLLTLDLLTLNQGDWVISGTASTALTVAPFALISVDKSDVTSQYSYCNTKNTYDLTGKTKLEMTGTGWHVTFGAVEFINAETGNVDYKYSRSASGKFDEIVTLPNLDGKYYIRLVSGVYNNASATTVTMTVFRLTH